MGLVTVEDSDSGSGGRTACNVTDVSDFVLTPLMSGFASSATVYRLSTARQLDRERATELTVTVGCHDGGRPPLSAEARFTVSVLDENDHPPRFLQSSYSVNVRENGSVPHMPILRVAAVDADEGPNADVWFSLADTPAARYATIDSETGMIRARDVLDHEVATRVELVVVASDRGVPVARTSSAVVSVSVVDINDESPTFTRSNYSFGTYENQPAGMSIFLYTTFPTLSYRYLKNYSRMDRVCRNCAQYLKCEIVVFRESHNELTSRSLSLAPQLQQLKYCRITRNTSAVASNVY